MVLACVNPANAAPNCCGDAPCCQAVGSNCTYDSSCTTLAKCNCADKVTTSGGVTTTIKQTHESYCIGSTAYSRCNLGNSTFTCASGYYGTATNSFSGCTACPANATCSGGNGSTFSCNKGYYKSGSSCTACPSGSTTSGTGATSKSACCESASSGNSGGGSWTKAACCYS